MKNASDALSTVEIAVPLSSGPLSPWLRLALIDSRFDMEPELKARKKRHKDFEMMLMLQGSAWIWCEAIKGSIDVHQGDLIFIPPGFVHAWCYTRETHLAVHFDLHANPPLDNWNTIENAGGNVRRHHVSTMPVFRIRMDQDWEHHELRIPMITRLKMPDVWRERFEHLIHIWQTQAGHTLDGQLVVNEVITWALNNLSSGHNGTASSHAMIDPRIADLLRATRDPRKRAELERLSTAELAHRSNMGISAFRRAFRTATGKHPYEYMVDRRIEQAARMIIQSDAKIIDIARAVGYDDPYHFSRVFRRVTGMSPSHFRTHHQMPDDRQPLDDSLA